MLQLGEGILLFRKKPAAREGVFERRRDRRLAAGDFLRVRPGQQEVRSCEVEAGQLVDRSEV